MKKYSLPLFAFLLLIAIWACESDTAVASAVSATKSTSAPARLPDEISAAVATTAIRTFDSIHLEMQSALWANNATKADTGYIVKGYQIPVADFADVLATVQRGEHAYAMIGVKRDGKGQLESTPSLIFQVKDSTGRYRYYDVVRPCPIDCPK